MKAQQKTNNNTQTRHMSTHKNDTLKAQWKTHNNKQHIKQN